MSNITLPNESAEYREHRDRLLTAEAELRAKIEEVASLRRSLPVGGEVTSYTFDSADGPVQLADLFGDHDTLILYSYMYAENAEHPCPMCSAFMDSLAGQIHHIHQRTAMAVVARSSMPRIQALVQQQSWGSIPWLSAANNTYPVDYKSEMPDGAQVPMCNVFVKRDGVVRHFWTSELFFVGWENHPRHVDMLWPLWHFFDLLPEGRGDFMPGLNYAE